MKKINMRDVLRIVLVLALVAGIGLAFGAVGRFVPTHKIVQPVYCGSCHPEQVAELGDTTHIGKFAYYIDRWMGYSNITAGEERNAARSISGGCVMCHNYWENMKWFGVTNLDFKEYDFDVPLPPEKDIYGNLVSPYGLGSTAQYLLNISYNSTTRMSAKPWDRGLNEYTYSDSSGTYHRLDYVWSRVSAVSPGPVGFRLVTPTSATTCAGGTIEHGMCHIATSAVALSTLNKKHEVADYPNGTGKFQGRSGSGTFFTHEMAFTTAQYAAKPVKICGACHILKLPPMRWGGEPWAVLDVQFADDPANEGIINNGPFGFRPTYNDLTGEVGDLLEHGAPESFPVLYRTPDWAHANVPCIRCHAHAGINGDTVTDMGQVKSYIIDPATGERIPP